MLSQSLARVPEEATGGRAGSLSNTIAFTDAGDVSQDVVFGAGI